METLTAILAHLCGQGQCFIIDGSALPVCQRCFGLYSAAAITGVWVVAARIWSRGLPPLGVSLVNVAMLLAAMLGGMHIFGQGPALRAMFGAWTGHVTVLWLVGGAGHLWRLSRRSAHEELPWRMREKAAAFAAAPALAVLAMFFALLAGSGWYAWTAIVLLGAGFLVLVLVLAAACALACLLSLLRRRRG